MRFWVSNQNINLTEHSKKASDVLQVKRTVKTSFKWKNDYIKELLMLMSIKGLFCVKNWKRLSFFFFTVLTQHIRWYATYADARRRYKISGSETKTSLFMAMAITRVLVFFSLVARFPFIPGDVTWARCHPQIDWVGRETHSL